MFLFQAWSNSEIQIQFPSLLFAFLQLALSALGGFSFQAGSVSEPVMAEPITPHSQSLALRGNGFPNSANTSSWM